MFKKGGNYTLYTRKKYSYEEEISFKYIGILRNLKSLKGKKENVFENKEFFHQGFLAGLKVFLSVYGKFD